MNEQNEKFVTVPKLALTYEEAEQSIGISVRTLKDLVARNEIPFTKIGKLVRFPVSDLQKWLHEGVKTDGQPVS